jgi:hypothetical protein
MDLLGDFVEHIISENGKKKPDILRGATAKKNWSLPDL